jgi:hypothetical protein
MSVLLRVYVNNPTFQVQRNRKSRDLDSKRGMHMQKHMQKQTQLTSNKLIKFTCLLHLFFFFFFFSGTVDIHLEVDEKTVVFAFTFIQYQDR